MVRSDDFLDKLKPANLKESLRRAARYWYLRLVRIQATPHNIALGLAVGVFAGLLPILPFQIAVAVTLAFIVRGSKIAAALGTWITNPLNWVPFYMMCYYIGKAVAPFEIPAFNPTRLEMTQMIELGWKFFAVMLVGGLVVAVPGSIVTYIATYKGMVLYRRHRAERGAARKAAQKANQDL
jgi:uncharacterized protein (DUF2062 family)